MIYVNDIVAPQVYLNARGFVIDLWYAYVNMTDILLNKQTNDKISDYISEEKLWKTKKYTQ